MMLGKTAETIDATPTDRDPMHLLAGMTAGAKLSPDTLFSRGSQLIVDCSHVQSVEHEGLSVIPVDEVFADPDAIFLGFGFPNVFLAIPREPKAERGPGWDRFAAFMFFRQAAYIADTKGRVQGGVLVELRGLPESAASQLRAAMTKGVGKRHISCANATGRALTAAGFTCGGKKLSRKIRPMRLARTIWERGLEFHGEKVELRLIRTNGGTVTDHFAGVIGKEATSGFRAVKKVMSKGKVKAKAPVIEPRELAPATPATSEIGHDDGQRIELFVGKPSKLGALLRRSWGEHPIFESSIDNARTSVAKYQFLHERLVPYPGELDLVSRLKRDVLFSRPVVRLIRSQMAEEMESLGHVPAKTIIDMLQVGTEDEPFIYNMVLTGSSVRISRLENKSDKDVAKANWVLAKHVLLSGYDPDVRFAGEIWAQDTPGGRIMHLNNNSGTYQPTEKQTASARVLLSEIFEVEAVAHVV